MNGFTIPVSKDFNSRVGSEIDGMLANDFLVMGKRDKHGAKGHSKKYPRMSFLMRRTPTLANLSI